MGGMLDDSVGLTTLQHLLSDFDGYGRRITLSAVDIETGDYVEFDQKNMDFYEIYLYIAIHFMGISVN